MLHIRSHTGVCARICAALLFFIVAPVAANDEPLVVAVASSFRATLQTLADRFEAEEGAPITLVSGATGALFAQASHGAPFDLFFAADTRRVDALVAADLAVADTRFTYAIGKLILVCGCGRQATLFELLSDEQLTVAIANPRLAPYGEAAQRYLNGRFDGRVITAQNVAATFALLHAGAADVAVLPAALVRSDDPDWLAIDIEHVSGALLQQDAVLTRRGEHNPAARKFLEFVRSPRQLRVIEAAGFALPAPL